MSSSSSSSTSQPSSLEPSSSPTSPPPSSSPLPSSSSAIVVPLTINGTAEFGLRFKLLENNSTEAMDNTAPAINATVSWPAAAESLLPQSQSSSSSPLLNPLPSSDIGANEAPPTLMDLFKNLWDHEVAKVRHELETALEIERAVNRAMTAQIQIEIDTLTNKCIGFVNENQTLRADKQKLELCVQKLLVHIHEKNEEDKETQEVLKKHVEEKEEKRKRKNGIDELSHWFANRNGTKEDDGEPSGKKNKQ